MISQDVVTAVDVDNLMSLTIGCGLLSAVIVAGVFGVVVATTAVGDDFSTAGLATVTVVIGFDESVTNGVPPITITPILGFFFDDLVNKAIHSDNLYGSALRFISILLNNLTYAPKIIFPSITNRLEITIKLVIVDGYLREWI